jgi:cell division protein FtsI/penicillin-binding protein 2
MLIDHEAWLVRSYRNRWAFRDVPSVRGALLDRFDRALAVDEPTFELLCVYERFRRLHPLGAAVHGATLLTRCTSAHEVRFGYGPPLGPEQALDELLATPVVTLQRRDFDRNDRRELTRAVLIVLAELSDRSSSRVHRELQQAAAAQPELALGDALPGCARGQLVESFRAVLARLRALDRALADLRSAGADAGRASGRGLLVQLDDLRVMSLEQTRTRGDGELIERLLRPLQRDLPFAAAAALHVAAADQPGLRLEPTLRRVRRVDLPPTLAQLLGGVAELDRRPPPADYVEQRVEAALADGLDELVPGDLVPSQGYREALRQEATMSYERVLRTRERRGTGGIEAMLDEALAGAPGLRLVEHDARSREQLLWSSLRVMPGADVAITIDLDLQAVLDERVAATAEHWQQVAGARGLDPRPIAAAIALIDVRSGDVLGLAGAPTAVDGAA